LRKKKGAVRCDSGGDTRAPGIAFIAALVRGEEVLEVPTGKARFRERENLSGLAKGG